MRPNTHAARAGQGRRAHARRGGAHRRRRGRCRHPQSHQLQAAGAGRLLPRPAPAQRRDPRPLRPADRRHAGHARRRSAPAATAAAASCKARRRRRSRSRSIPASSRSSPTAPPRSSFDIPAFAGTVRVMAVAWSKDKVGQAVGDVIVRDPVVVTATLPRFLLTGDRGDPAARPRQRRRRRPATTAWRSQPKAPLSVGDGATQTLAARRQAAQRRLAAAQRVRRRHRHGHGARHRARRLRRSSAAIALDVRAGDAGAGAPHGAADRQGREPHALERPVRRSRAGHRQRGAVGRRLRPRSMPRRSCKALDRYPFGCSEQITSRALPLLYVNDLAAEAQLALDTAVDQRIRDAIDRLLARQGSNGSFGLWSAGGDDAWLDAYVTDFLTRARERGFAVPDVGVQAGARPAAQLSSATRPSRPRTAGASSPMRSTCWRATASAPVGDLRYLADTKLDDVATPIAKAQIAAALGLLGDSARAERVYAAALDAIAPRPRARSRPRRLRLGAARCRGAGDARLGRQRAAPDHRQRGVPRVEAARAADAPTPRPRRMPGWCWPRARSPRTPRGVSLDVAGEAHAGRALSQRQRGRRSQAAPLTVTNTGEDDAAGGGLGDRRAAGAGAGGRARLQDRAQLLHARRRAGRHRQGQAERALRRGAARSPSRSRSSAASSSPTICRPASRSTIRGWSPPAIPARCAWIEDAQEPVQRRVPRRPLHRGVRAQGRAMRRSSPSPMWCARCRPAATCMPQAYVEDMYRPDRFGRTATGTLEVTAAK